MPAKILLRDCATLRDFLEDAFVNQVIKLRDNRERGDVALAQSAQKFGGVKRFEIYNARAFHQRQQQIRHLRQHVEERQHAQQRIGGAEVNPVEDGFHFAQKFAWVSITPLGSAVVPEV